jgi:hypothetical protein
MSLPIGEIHLTPALTLLLADLIERSLDLAATRGGKVIFMVTAGCSGR